jgi:hypothetical protein
MGTHSSGRPTTPMQAANYQHLIRESDVIWLRRGQRLGEMLLALASWPETRKEPAISNRVVDPAA